MDLPYEVKNMRIIRALCKPYMDIKKRREYKRYLRSEDSLTMKSFRNCHRGKRCFVIGNGPSLTVDDLERLKNEYTFASNRIFDIFEQTDWRPSFYLAVDPNFLRQEYDKLHDYDMDMLFLGTDEQIHVDVMGTRTIRIFEYGSFKISKWNDLSATISEDVSDHFSIGYTVTFSAIQLAIYMGFQEIYLLGVDFNYSLTRDSHGRAQRDNSIKDYFSGKRFTTSVLNYEPVLHAYQVAKEYCDIHGIIIRNITRGGKLEVFERMDIDQILGTSN